MSKKINKTKAGKVAQLPKLYTEKIIVNASEELRNILEKKKKDLVDKPDDYKLKVLWVSESSVLGTGFSTYTKEILTRLHKTGKYDIAEMGSYVSQQDPRLEEIPWKCYGVMADTKIDEVTGKMMKNKQQDDVYASKHSNQFGEWKFNPILLDFLPDVVIDNRDWWMVEFEERTPLRENFIWILMVPVDGDPQKWEWMSTYERADIVLSYSEYGKKVLESQSGNKIKVAGVPSPGVDLGVFKPVSFEEKCALRRKYFNPPNDGSKLKIIGTVMRNQGRKLFPTLFQALRMYYDKYPKEFKHLILHCHTSIPDVGWDIRESLRRTGMMKYVTFTYLCEACNHVFISFIMGDAGTNYYGQCQKCGEYKAKTPNTNKFLSREQLAEIYQLMDVYVQFSISEGFGMPIVEAKACGVPVMVTDNTAMAEQARNGGGFPIAPVKDGPFSTFTECLGHGSGTGMREWDLPSRIAIVKMWHKFFALNKIQRDMLSKQARQSTKTYYDWDHCGNFWIDLLDGCKIKDRSKYWDKPPELHNKENITSLKDIPEELTNEDFIRYLYSKILNNDIKTKDKGFVDWMNSLNNGITRNKVVNFFIKTAEQNNKREMTRCKIEPVEEADDEKVILI